MGSILLLLGVSLFGGLPAPGSPVSGPTTPSILIEDRHGRLLYEVIDPYGSKQVPLPLAEIPLACRQGTIATEDSRFYSHPGVDPLAIARALWQNLRAASASDGATAVFSGASTLTQQLARNLYLSAEERGERSLRRKLREAWLAWRLERAYSKDELLALYLNTTYYGHYAVGIEAAAQAYFGVHARELDLAQCALLVGLPQNPSAYNPIENPQAARQRQRLVLNLMVRDGYITAAQADDAWGEELAYASTPFPIEAPHFVMWVQSQLEALLPAEVLRQGGLRVETTLDLDWQGRAEAIVRRRLAQLQPCNAGPGQPPAAAACDPEADPGRRVENVSLVALDPQSGAIRAWVGSPDYFNPAISGAVNGALALRQPGSAIKPITYAVALDPSRAAADGRAPWTAATLIADLRTVFPTREGRPYVPQNYDRRYHGPVTVRQALANSYNIPAVKALAYVGVDALVDQASRMGIPWHSAAVSSDPLERARLAASDGADLPLPHADAPGVAGAPEPGPSTSASPFGLALTLGGGEVRLLDLTAAYAAFANGGLRVTPYGISRVLRLDGEVLYPAQEPLAGRSDVVPQPAVRDTRRALDARVAFLITDILSDEVARQPAFGPNNVLEIGRPAAVKTGTTTDWRDNWTIGYTPNLVTGVWVGNADNTPMRDVSGVSGAGPIWHDFMVEVLAGTPTVPFTLPEGLIRVEICADSGLLPADPAAPAAARAGGAKTAQTQYRSAESIPCPYRRPEWFIPGTEPTEVDLSHQRIAIDLRTGRRASAATPSEYVHWQTFWVLPEEYAAWARANGIEQPPPADGDEQQSPASPPLTAEGLSRASEKAASPVARQQGPPRGDRAGQGVANPGEPGAGTVTLVSPEPNRVYRLDPALPPAAQQIPVTAQVSRALQSTVLEVTLLLDGEPLATVGGPDYIAWWPLERGRHTFQAIVGDPQRAQVASNVVTVLVQ